MVLVGTQPKRIGGWRLAVAVATLLAGLCTTVVLTWYVHSLDDKGRQEEFLRLARGQAAPVEHQFRDGLTAVRQGAAFMSAGASADVAGFIDFQKQSGLDRDGRIFLAWAPRVTSAQRAAWQEAGGNETGGPVAITAPKRGGGYGPPPFETGLLSNVI